MHTEKVRVSLDPWIETTMDVTILKKRTTTRTRRMGRSRHVATGMQDEVVIHSMYGCHVATGMQDEVDIHTCYVLS
jgi:hypothetical protein